MFLKFVIFPFKFLVILRFPKVIETSCITSKTRFSVMFYTKSYFKKCYKKWVRYSDKKYPLWNLPSGCHSTEKYGNFSQKSRFGHRDQIFIKFLEWQFFCNFGLNWNFWLNVFCGNSISPDVVGHDWFDLKIFKKCSKEQ